LPGTTTFAAQASLLKLPVPELPVTLTRLKEALKPLAKSELEYTAAVTKIDEFGRGKGIELQDRLLKRNAETIHWLEGWWDDLGYLGYRDSVCASRSYPIVAS
jgi:carnitine O-acetyltransferase